MEAAAANSAAIEARYACSRYTNISESPEYSCGRDRAAEIDDATISRQFMTEAAGVYAGAVPARAAEPSRMCEVRLDR